MVEKSWRKKGKRWITSLVELLRKIKTRCFFVLKEWRVSPIHSNRRWTDEITRSFCENIFLGLVQLINNFTSSVKNLIDLIRNEFNRTERIKKDESLIIEWMWWSCLDKNNFCLWIRSTFDHVRGLFYHRDKKKENWRLKIYFLWSKISTRQSQASITWPETHRSRNFEVIRWSFIW